MIPRPRRPGPSSATEAMPYQATTQIPRIPATQLKTRATIPRGVKLQNKKRQRHASRMWKGVEGGYEPSRESRRGDVLAGEVEVVLCVAGSVALGGHTGGFAGLEMVVGDRERLL